MALLSSTTRKGTINHFGVGVGWWLRFEVKLKREHLIHTTSFIASVLLTNCGDPAKRSPTQNY